MAQSVGRSPAPRTAANANPAPVRNTALAPRSAPAPAAPRPQPRNPHLSDYSQTNALRSQIDRQARANPSGYGNLVGTVNGMLQAGGFGISPASHRSVMDNLRQVHQGTIPQSTAHFREASTFARDAVESYRHGRPVQGLVESTGAWINTQAGSGTWMVETASAAGRALVDLGVSLADRVR